MGDVLRRRIGTDRSMPLGEQLLLAVSIAAGDAGAGTEQILRDRGLTRARYNVLRILRGAGQDGLPAKEIGERLLVPSPDVTRLVDPLVAGDVMARAPSAEDRRVSVHRLTDTGAALLRELDGELREAHQALVDALGEADSRRLVELCERLIRVTGGVTLATAEGGA